MVGEDCRPLIERVLERQFLSSKLSIPYLKNIFDFCHYEFLKNSEMLGGCSRMSATPGIRKNLFVHHP
jgi:hypothetical protein